CHFGTDGRPVVDRKTGAHRWTARYDEAGNVIEEAYFGVDGRPVVSTSGFAKLTRVYDAQGTLLEKATWVLDPDGNYVLERRANGQDKTLEQVNLTADGRPAVV